jgi:hypothetical protein
MVKIYGLVCPLACRVRYIGKSISPRKRLSAHISCATRNAYDHHTARWIRKIVSLGLQPSLIILEEVAEGVDWRSVERRWIAKATSEGWPLTNTTAGGEGLDYIDPEAEERYKLNHRNAMKSYACTEKGRAGIAKMAQASMAPDVRRQAAARLRQTFSDPDVKARLGRSISEAQNRPETKAKRSGSLKAAWASNKQSMLSKIWKEDSREKHRESHKAAWKSQKSASE